MTFPDLANPEDIAEEIKLLDKEYSGLFKWMGEVNVHKEALRGNGHEPASLEDIAQWAKFMTILRDRGIPIALHSDLGTDDEATKNLVLSEVNDEAFRAIVLGQNYFDLAPGCRVTIKLETYSASKNHSAVSKI